MILEGLTLEEAKEYMKDFDESKNKFVYIVLTDLYESESTYHIVRKNKLALWLADLSSTKETAYIYEVVEDYNGELKRGRRIENVELNK